MLNKELKQKVGQLVGVSRSEEDLAYDVLVEKVSESLEYFNAIKVDGLGIFANKTDDGGSELIFIPSYKAETKDALYYTLKQESKSETDFDENIFSPAVKRKFTPVKSNSSTGSQESIKRQIEEKIVEILSESEQLNDFDIWKDYLNNKIEKNEQIENITAPEPVQEEHTSLVDEFDFEELGSTDFFAEEKEETEEEQNQPEQLSVDESAPGSTEEPEEELSIDFDFDKLEAKTESRFERIDSIDLPDEQPEESEKPGKESDILSSFDDLDYQEVGSTKETEPESTEMNSGETDDFDFGDSFSELELKEEDVSSDEPVISKVDEPEKIQEEAADDDWDMMRKTLEEFEEDTPSDFSNLVEADDDPPASDIKDDANIWDLGDDLNAEAEKEEGSEPELVREDAPAEEEKTISEQELVDEIKNLPEIDELNEPEEPVSEVKEEEGKVDKESFVPKNEKPEGDAPENEDSNFDKKTWDEIYKDFEFSDEEKKEIKSSKKEKVAQLEERRKGDAPKWYKSRLLLAIFGLFVVIATVAYFYLAVNEEKEPIQLKDVISQEDGSDKTEQENSDQPEVKAPEEVDNALDQTLQKLDEDKKPETKPVVQDNKPKITTPVSSGGLYKDFTGATRVQNLIFRHDGGYYVQVSSVRRARSAESEAKRFERQGNNVHIWKVYLASKKTNWHRVMVGPFSSVEEARRFL